MCFLIKPQLHANSKAFLFLSCCIQTVSSLMSESEKDKNEAFFCGLMLLFLLCERSSFDSCFRHRHSAEWTQRLRGSGGLCLEGWLICPFGKSIKTKIKPLQRDTKHPTTENKQNHYKDTQNHHKQLQRDTNYYKRYKILKGYKQLQINTNYYREIQYECKDVEDIQTT